ncbi:carboxymuconolactone decarboxylase family protein [Acidimicrobium ferrooxidans]|nr:carboxymuconolactone decarboxylase family protein [Acidimicrobium ferrooxidans]
MEFLPLVSDEEEGTRDAFAEFRKGMGIPFTPNLMRIQGASASTVRSTWGLLSNSLLSGSLPRSLKEMILVAISASRGCHYCEAAHLACCRMLGIDASTITVLTSDISAITPARTRIILQFAIKCATAPQSITQSDCTQLREFGINDAELLEVMGMAAAAVYINILADATKVELDPGFNGDS